MDKYLSVDLKKEGKNIVCVGGEHECTSLVITAPSVDQFGSSLAY